MINPYRAPAEPIGPTIRTDEVVAEFQLGRSQIRHAESKFLLHGYGLRLSVASLFLIALAVLAVFDWPWLNVSRPANTLPTLLVSGSTLMVRELMVMLLATVVYLALIHRATIRMRARLRRHGVVEGESVTVRLAGDSLHWTSSQGTFSIPCQTVRPLTTLRGTIVPVESDLFWFIPKSAYFSIGDDKDFVKRLKEHRRG